MISAQDQGAARAFVCFPDLGRRSGKKVFLSPHSSLLMVKGVDPAQIEGASATPPALALSSQDLEKVLGLLALAADRGAFQIQEFRDVGTLWTKLDGLVRSQPKP